MLYVSDIRCIDIMIICTLLVCRAGARVVIPLGRVVSTPSRVFPLVPSATTLVTPRAGVPLVAVLVVLVTVTLVPNLGFDSHGFRNLGFGSPGLGWTLYLPPGYPCASCCCTSSKGLPPQDGIIPWFRTQVR